MKQPLWFRTHDAMRRTTKSIHPHTTQLRHNKAANATWTGRIDTSTPGKAGSVSNETQPSTPDASTKAPIMRSASFRSEDNPINVKPPNNSAHHQLPIDDSHKRFCPEPSAAMMPSMVPRQPKRKPVPLVGLLSPPRRE